MLLDQVLDADSDEPPNFRSLLLLFLMSLCANTAGCAAMNYDTVIKDSVRGEVVAEKVEYAGRMGKINMKLYLQIVSRYVKIFI